MNDFNESPLASVKEHYNEILSMYFQLLQDDPIDYSNNSKPFHIPIVPIPILVSLLKTMAGRFYHEPIIVHKESPCVIVGDIHGHIIDLLRIFKDIGTPPDNNYIFLGDYVDRGPFSLETITLLLLLKYFYPQKVTLIRGNHEFRELCTSNGFLNEIMSTYNDESIFDFFDAVFNFMPLGCIIDQQILCVHGGLGPSVKDIRCISRTERPIKSFMPGPITELLWSDPDEECNTFEESKRGSGYRFGVGPLLNFLKNEKLSMIIRGHQCVANGVEFALRNQIVTVFSASNYCGKTLNSAGALLVKGKILEPRKYPAISLLERNKAHFIHSDLEFHFRGINLMSFVLKKNNERSSSERVKLIKRSHAGSKAALHSARPIIRVRRRKISFSSF